MRRNRKQGYPRRSGFTLLEVLLVVGIIALLAAFVVPSLLGTEDRAKNDLARRLVGGRGEIATALDLYRLHMGDYPEELAELVEPPDDKEDEEKWAGPYLKDVESLKDPWGHDVQYKYPGDVNENGFDLWSLGKDEDDDDDNVNSWHEK